jgi:hypothetical protein
MTIKARLVGHSHGDLEKGDVTELSEAAYKAFSDKFERVDDDEPEVTGNETEGEDSTSPSDNSSDYPREKGAGWYELSNGETVRGKENAEDIEAEL